MELKEKVRADQLAASLPEPPAKVKSEPAPKASKHTTKKKSEADDDE
jgi:hypothetical protein